MEYVLGVDVGTGSVKAVAVNLQCQSFTDQQLYYSFSSPRPGYHEQNPEQIWNAFATSIKGIIEKIGNPPSLLILPPVIALVAVMVLTVVVVKIGNVLLIGASFLHDSRHMAKGDRSIMNSNIFLPVVTDNMIFYFRL